MLTRSLAPVVAALTLLLPGVAPSQEELTVYPSNIRPKVIAVPPFATADGTDALGEGTFSDVILRNLQISGWFTPLPDPRLASQQDRSDRARGQTDFAEWGRIGADYLVRGTYAMSSGQIVADVEVFDVSIGQRVIGRRYERIASQQRDMAHAIADEIVETVTSERGIAQSRILYIAQSGPRRELAVMDCDGGRQRNLTNDGATVMAACWGANNTEVYFTSTRDYNPDLCGIFLDGSELWYISRLPGLNLSPSWNPRTQRIALTISRDGNSEIYTMNRDGSSPLRLTHDRGIDSSPCWTPDGRQILFTSDRASGRPQLYVMDGDGRGQRRLTVRTGNNYNDGASVSPDGRRVAFSSRLDGQFDIFVMDISGADSSWQRLTNHPGDDEDPFWTWDGQHLVFSSTRTGSKQIHIMNADGSNVHQLTTRGVNLSPVAEPLPPTR